MSDLSRPKLLITMGDPLGIGPEVIAKALCDGDLLGFCNPKVLGHPAPLLRAFDLLGKDGCADIETVYDLPENPTKTDRGHFVYAAIEKATKECLAGNADAVVTGPIDKSTLEAAGLHFPGHTEIFGKLTGADPVMMLTGGPLRVIPLTTHLPLMEVAGRLSIDGIVKTCLAVHHSLTTDFSFQKPRIALTGLNPHAGEGGLFGDEEQTLLIPALIALSDQGIDIVGPLPADTAYFKAAQGNFDAVISPTHDQALIPLKLLAFHDSVNVTLNLPIVRTSPGHGTAEDIAWTGKANPSSMKAAIETAITIAHNRKRLQEADSRK